MDNFKSCCSIEFKFKDPFRVVIPDRELLEVVKQHYTISYGRFEREVKTLWKTITKGDAWALYNLWSTTLATMCLKPYCFTPIVSLQDTQRFSAAVDYLYNEITSKRILPETVIVRISNSKQLHLPFKEE